MKQKRFFKICLLLLLFSFFACLSPKPKENPLLGSWKYSNYYTGSWEKIIFRGELSYRLETYNAESNHRNVLEGTYRYDSRKFILEQRYSRDVVFEYQIHGDSLISMSKVYLRQ